MGDYISIQQGAAPWAPSADAEVIAEYRYYEVPLEGVVRQHGVEYLFVCMTGDIDTVSFWVYSRITPDERATLEAATTPEAYEQLLLTHDLNTPVVVALAVDAVGILASEVVETDDLLPAALQRLSDYLQSLASDAKELATA